MTRLPDQLLYLRVLQFELAYLDFLRRLGGFPDYPLSTYGLMAQIHKIPSVRACTQSFTIIRGKTIVCLGRIPGIGLHCGICEVKLVSEKCAFYIYQNREVSCKIKGGGVEVTPTSHVNLKVFFKHLFPETQVTSNEMKHKKKHYFFAQFYSP